jgi:tetratricopeptide (TPR) repeat protein
LKELAFLFLEHKQLEAAENAASRAIDLVPGKGQEYLVCQLHRVLGKIHRFKGDKNKAIHHFNTALEIASPFNWNDHLFWIHYVLADLFLNENEFDDAHAHTERAKSHAVDNTYRLGRAMRMQAGVWYRQRRFKEAKSEALQAVEIFEKFGAATDADHCREFLRLVEQAMGSPSTSFQRSVP